MFSATTATMALMAASAAAQSIGSAVVENTCSYDVYMANTPASNGGFSTISKTISPGDSYTQTWTELTNLQGWSIKLAPSQELLNSIPMQYEYTFLNAGTVWFDISYVNGDPFDGNWVMNGASPDNSCKPKHTSYWYPTNDAYAMQDCNSDASITLVLCGNDTAPAYSSSAPVASPTTVQSSAAPTYVAPTTSVVAASSSVAPTTTAEPTPSSVASPSSQPTWSHHPWSGYHDLVESSTAAAVVAPSPTTFATVATAADGDVMTVIDVEYVTDLVTQTLWVRDAAPTPVAKRHQHHPHAHHA